MTVKRIREDNTDVETLAMANCMMLLSRLDNNTRSSPPLGRGLFSCKTCNRQFQSFQALGGHRASHKKTKPMPLNLFCQPPHAANKANKTHECSICGLKFAIGQALGGHMRRHRRGESVNKVTKVKQQSVPVLKRSNSSKRVLCLDLNLTPYENGLQVEKVVGPPLDLGLFI